MSPFARTGRLPPSREPPDMDVVAVIGDKLYHAAGSECARRLADAGGSPLLSLSEAQAQEVGMEPCGVCVGASDDPASPSGS